MKKPEIELFLPFEADALGASLVERCAADSRVKGLYLLSAGAVDVPLHDKVFLLQTDSLVSTAFFKNVAARATADYVLFCAKPGLDVDVEKVWALVDSVPAGATMAYAHYRKSVDGVVTDAPTIEYASGSLRNDFDFGSLLLFRTSALKECMAELLEEYKYAGLYQLRLALSRKGAVYHYCDYLYTEPERDNRKSGEKQFDYVNPAQREVQVEMECVCTAHLKMIGGCLPACKYTPIDLYEGDFAVEASVVIPVLNRASTIADAIGSVLDQKTSFPFNIIVVDNHSTDGTSEIIDGFGDSRVVHIIPSRTDLGIGGCWNEAVNSSLCGRFAVQLDSDDLYSSENTLQRIVDEFYKQQCAMLIGSYRICDFELNTLPPGVIDHREWSEENGRNNALRINGLGAPRAFYTPVIRQVGFPNVSYGEDYAVGLQISRNYRIGRIYDVLYLCRRWGGNSDAALSHEKVNAHNTYKDSLRTAELMARCELVQKMSIPSAAQVDAFFAEQLAAWPEAAGRYKALEGVRTRELGNGITLQYNPARIVSTGARVDSVSVGSRPCFLCEKNRPAQQVSVEALGSLTVLVNPYPILPFHLTLPLKEHLPQRLATMYVDALHLAKEWQGTALFYNGAKCGASAPDHAHLQAARVSDIPLLGEQWSSAVADTMQPVYMQPSGAVFSVTGYVVPFFMVVAKEVSSSVELMDRVVAALPADANEEAPMNVIVHYTAAEGYITIVIPRAKHRPACYFATGDGHRLVSPGTLDVAGLVITPRGEDFEKITADEALAILQEVGVSEDEAADICEKIAALQ